MLKIAGALSATILPLLPSIAHAHGGHLGELAGHSHWAGVAAIAGAALVAGIVALKDRKKKDTAEKPDAEAETAGETEAEAAQ
ncbi:DUF6732 family protein [Roseibium aggregatum]|uniref:LPXTG-motif cell wall-anchored protein n=1 Tax=Roseibium aggregatum TaxID=187304 RepID=A0A926SAE7_9HYPH|nr:DUF6732 family protein [Roseibium aggregatum]MBD1548934.1 hypothetical protein [Roseibium aggregatum]